jgi:hypothetical protein
MDAAAVIGRFGAKKILVDLVNVDDDGAAQKFVERYGPLRPRHAGDVDEGEYNPAADVCTWTLSFRRAWDAHRSQEETARLNEALDWAFVEAWLERTTDHPVLHVDFDTGQYRPEPVTLLEFLAVELVRSRKMLHRCEWPECQRYFVKDFSRDRYCQRKCAEQARAKGQSDWIKRKRQEQKKKRRAR